MSSRGRSRGHSRGGARAPSPSRRPRRSPNRRSRSPNKPRNRRLGPGGRSPPPRRRPGSTSPRRRRINSRSPSPPPRNKLGPPLRPRRMSKSPVRRRSISPVRRRSISPARRRSISPVRRGAFSPVRGPFGQRVGPRISRSRSRSPRRHVASPKRVRSRSPSVVPLSPVRRAQMSPIRRAQLSPVGRIPEKMALSPPPHIRAIRGVDRSGPGPYRVEPPKVPEAPYRDERKRNEAPRNEPVMYRQQESTLANSRPPLPAMGSYDHRSKSERYLEVGGSGISREGPREPAGLDTDLRHRSRRSPSPLADTFNQPDKRFSVIPLLDGTTQTFRDHKSSTSKPEDSSRRMGYELNLEDRPLVGERFCGGQNTPAEGRMYTHEELKKITVDIRRNVPMDGPPGLSRVINPQNVVVVRRPEEGARPIFDRDEIRQAHTGHGSSYRGKGGEGDFAPERRVVAIVKERSRSPHSEESSSIRKRAAGPGAGIDEREDFQVSRDTYENFGSGDEFRKGGEQRRTTLSEKWATYSERGRLQGSLPIAEKPVAPSQQMRSTVGGFFSSGERVEVPHRSQFSPERDSPLMYHPRASDAPSRDPYAEGQMRTNLYSQQQSDKHSSQHHHHQLQPEPQQQQHFPRSEDSRHQLGGKRRSQIGEVRPRHGSPPLFERRQDRQPDDSWDKDFAARKRFRDDDRNAPDTTTDPFYRESYREGVGGLSRGGEKDLFRQDMKDALDSNLPNFASRPDKYRYQEWIDKPDMVPKGPSYYEHDTRGESSYDSSWFGRGRGRGVLPVRGRARGRATPFARGGRILSRGGNGGGGVGGGGRGIMMALPSRRKPSPNQWKHDMFDEISPDRKSEQDNKPTSTTEGK